MLFSERILLVEEYQEWLEDLNALGGYEVSDSPFSFLIFLHEKGLLKEKGDATNE